MTREMGWNKRRFFILLLALCMLLTAPACAESFDVAAYSYEELVEIRDAVVEKIAEMDRQYAIENGNRKIIFEEEAVQLLRGRTQQLSPSVERVVEEAPAKTQLVYSSSDPEVAKVSNTGLITAVSVGEAVITCSAKDDELVFSELPVAVVETVAGVTLDQDTAALLLKSNDPAAAKLSLTATVAPENAFWQTVVWTSSDESVATVDANGHVKAIAPGSATITATSEEEPAKDQKVKSASCKVTVGQAVEKITLSDAKLVLNKSKGAALKAEVFPENATQKTVEWVSSNPDVVSVTKDGRLTAKACGMAFITCKAADGSGVADTCEVEVIQMVTSLTPETKNITLSRGATAKAAVKVLPADATVKALKWKSSAPSVVSVSESGVLEAVNGGTATITCTAADGSEKTASFTVYVPSIAVSTKSCSITSKAGLQFTFHYYGNYGALKITSSARNTVDFIYTHGEGNTVIVNLIPKRFGKAVLTIADSNEPKSTVKVNVSVEHSAVYDTVSYPKASYDAILRNPDGHYGDQISIYGRVLQKMQSGSTVVLRVGTRGYNDVFYVRYDTDELPISIIEDDRITVYGVCLGDYTYESVWGQSITIPEMRAEMIVLKLQ